MATINPLSLGGRRDGCPHQCYVVCRRRAGPTGCAQPLTDAERHVASLYFSFAFRKTTAAAAAPARSPAATILQRERGEIFASLDAHWPMEPAVG